MSSYTALLDVAKLGVPLTTAGYVYGKAKKKKKRGKDIIAAGVGGIVGASFTNVLY